MIDCKVGDFFIGWREHHARDHFDFVNLASVHERDARASWVLAFLFGYF